MLRARLYGLDQCQRFSCLFLGYIVQNAIVSLPYGGSKIADVLRSKLSEQNPGVYSFMSPVERYILRYIVEQVNFAFTYLSYKQMLNILLFFQTCYVAEDYDEEIEKYEQSPADIDTVVKMDRFDLREETFRYDLTSNCESLSISV